MVGIAIRIGTVVAERAAPYILRALPPILGGTGGVIVGDQLSKELENKQEEASRAKSSSIAKADASVQSKEKCEACPPMAGVPITKNFKEHRSWMDYQLRITGMPSGPGFLTEWLYARREFDGFKPAECLLIETKAGYDQFFNDDEEFDYPFQRGIMNKMLGQVRDQNDVAVPRPPVQLRWYFMEPSSYAYMRPLILRISPTIQVVYEP